MMASLENMVDVESSIEQRALAETMQQSDRTESMMDSFVDPAVPRIRSVHCEEEESYDDYNDERTIDAAAVVEIFDEVEVDAPVHLAPQVDGPVRILEQNTGIPEVEPEVDIEEVDFDDRTDSRSISALTMSIAIAAVRDEVEDVKPAATPSPSFFPVSIPEQRELATTTRSHSNGSGSNGRRSNGSCTSLPDYKAQVNSRSVADTVIAAEVRHDVDDLSCTAEMADILQGGGSGRTDATRTAKFNDGRAVSPKVDNNLPSFKDQSRNWSPPNRSPISSRQVSSNSSGGNYHHEDQQLIPVVSAVLVPASLIAEEESQRNDHQRHHESGTSTLTADGSSNNKSSDRVGSDNSHPLVASERKFWLTLIFVALFLNSLLVTGAIVGGFCAAGKCSSSSSPPPSTVSQGGETVEKSPSSAPTQHRVLSVEPSSAPTQHLHFSGTLVRAPTVPPQPSRAPLPTVSPRPSSPLSMVVTMPTSANRTIGTLSPAVILSSGKINGSPVPALTRAPSLISTMPPTVVTAGKTEQANNNGKSGVPLNILVPIVVGFEIFIVAGLVMYYRRWKRRRELYSNVSSNRTEQTSIYEETVC